MNLADSYLANYDLIAKDHLAYWNETGLNPFQEQGAIDRNTNKTEQLILFHARPEPGQSILDAGCGMGDLLVRFKQLELHGYDISTGYLDVARRRGIKTRQGWIEKMPYRTGRFDIVTCTDVLEHVLDLNACVRELLRVLKPGGVLVVRAPNEEDLTGHIGNPTYKFVHLRRFDQATFVLLFTKVFDCEVLETCVAGETVHAVVRK